LPRVTYIEASGTEHVIDVSVGCSVMQGAVQNRVPGILGECGGVCACGTCRVYVAEGWRSQTGGASEMEEAMMDPNDTKPGRRLGCQIEVSDALDGLVVHMPERQF
jgi:ferredoxin, 2Fe-2S